MLIRLLHIFFHSTMLQTSLTPPLRQAKLIRLQHRVTREFDCFSSLKIVQHIFVLKRERERLLIKRNLSTSNTVGRDYISICNVCRDSYPFASVTLAFWYKKMRFLYSCINRSPKLSVILATNTIFLFTTSSGGN